MKAAEKLDLLELHKADYVAPKKPVLLTIAPATYLAIDGRGHPGDAHFTAQIGALYGIAFTTRMQRKFAGRGDYTIAKLEARWADMSAGEKLPWSWELLIRTPEFVTDDDLQSAAAALVAKGHPAAVQHVQRRVIDEGRCVQMLHVGPYEQEPATVRIMTDFAAQHALRAAGPHHEIYLSDPRRVPPERLRTILRLPVAPI